MVSTRLLICFSLLSLFFWIVFLLACFSSSISLLFSATMVTCCRKFFSVAIWLTSAATTRVSSMSNRTFLPRHALLFFLLEQISLGIPSLVLMVIGAPHSPHVTCLLSGLGLDCARGPPGAVVLSLMSSLDGLVFLLAHRRFVGVLVDGPFRLVQIS